MASSKASSTASSTDTRRPGRKLVPDLELTPHRIAQRAFRARRQEKIASLEERVRQLEEENVRLLDRRGGAPDSLLTAFAPLLLVESDRLFISSHCHFSFQHLPDPTLYIQFCLALGSFLPITGLGATSRLSKPLAEVLEEEQARTEKECCYGMVDCSRPNIIDSTQSVRPYEYMASPIAWNHFAIFSIEPEEVAVMLGKFMTRQEGVYGGVVRCDKDLGLLVAKEAVLEVRDAIVRSALAV